MKYTPTDVPCPLCKAAAGAWCKRNGKPLFPVHRARHREYLNLLKQTNKTVEPNSYMPKDFD